MEAPSPPFDTTFLRWFQSRTEATWETYQTTTIEEYQSSGAGGRDWQRGTRWIGGLSEDEITLCEQRWSLSFPPDYRLFLHTLHCPNKPKRGARYEHNVLVPYERPLFPNWQKDEQFLTDALHWPLKAVLYNVEDGLWRPGWGKRPRTLAARKAVVTELVSHAPPLIPLAGRHYLLSTPLQAGNPTLFVYPSEFLLYAHNLSEFFLFEFRHLLGLDKPQPVFDQEDKDWFHDSNPFWFDLYARP